jgi:hypothetical protein
MISCCALQGFTTLQASANMAQRMKKSTRAKVKADEKDGARGGAASERSPGWCAAHEHACRVSRIACGGR